MTASAGFLSPSQKENLTGKLSHNLQIRFNLFLIKTLKFLNLSKLLTWELSQFKQTRLSVYNSNPTIFIGFMQVGPESSS